MRSKIIILLALLTMLLGTAVYGQTATFAAPTTGQEPPLRDSEPLDAVIADLERYIPEYMREEHSIDANKCALETARSGFDQENIQFVQMGAGRLAFANEYFGTVSMSGSLHHLAADGDATIVSHWNATEAYSRIFVIYWLHRIPHTEEPVLYHPNSQGEPQPLGIFATRAPIRPNPIGLALVELVKREGNILWVKSLDAFDGTPVLDIKPYPDWERGRFIVVTDFRVPEWLTRIIEGRGNTLRFWRSRSPR